MSWMILKWRQVKRSIMLKILCQTARVCVHTFQVKLNFLPGQVSSKLMTLYALTDLGHSRSQHELFRPTVVSVGLNGRRASGFIQTTYTELKIINYPDCKTCVLYGTTWPSKPLTEIVWLTPSSKKQKRAVNRVQIFN